MGRANHPRLIGKLLLAYDGPVADIFKALADLTRRRILDELAERGDQTLFEICARLAARHGLASTRQAVSQHLDVLEAAGLVVTRRQGRYKYHTLNRAPLARIADRWTSPQPEEETMRITLTSVYVDDQDKALQFYTQVLGFVKKTEVPLGEHRWLTVVSPGEPDGVELVLEPADHPAVGPYRQALAADGIPATSFAVPDVHAEHARLAGLGVEFTQPPTEMGPVTTAVFDDTCGNLIQIAHQR
jgi:DNA-binding transcriptional ArsR family regulator